MRRILLRSAILIASLVVLLSLWILAGRSFSLLLDRFGSARLESRRVDRVDYEGNQFGGILEIAELPLNTQGQNYNSFPLILRPDAKHQLVLTSAGRSFILGPLLSGGSKFRVDPETGDQVSLDVRQSFLSWPTPFDFNFMTGHSPSWKRNLYYVLEWRKVSGQRLEMVWRYEQYFYPSDGWTSGFMTREGATGLMRVEISH